MKKIFSILLLVSVMAAAVLPALAFAANEPLSGCTVKNADKLGGGCANGPCTFETNPNCGFCCTLSTVYTVTNWVFYFLVAVSVLFIILAGFKFVMSGDNPDEVAKARQMILFAAVGIGVALLARAVPSLVSWLLSGGA
ncbi:MAG: hypothetical protein PHI77_02440 [Candidatus Pacebacteria bacterium]|nr:hypothetical protein [Candidatus Paceibacterota bacterium]MDD4830678.1 hypothetical protein [Candidatus Paceibacterota bacterium]MDD4875242.1 hypothetical protein [Candidatus Paceibacterota bacterium]